MMNFGRPCFDWLDEEHPRQHVDQTFGKIRMKTNSITCEISGPTAMWTRPDTGDVPVSYPAPTYAAVKGIFESIVWLKSDTMREAAR